VRGLRGRPKALSIYPFGGLQDYQKPGALIQILLSVRRVVGITVLKWYELRDRNRIHRTVTSI